MELQIGTGWHSGKHRDSRSPRQICRAPLEQQREDRAWGSGESRLPGLILVSQDTFVEGGRWTKYGDHQRYGGNMWGFGP